MDKIETMSHKEAVLKNKEQEIRDIARKAVLMTPQSIKTLIFATDVLLARDQMENGEQACERC